MLNAAQTFIPIANSEAGLCLTAANWLEVNVNRLAYSLEALLLKPGYEVLTKIPNVGHYLGWSGSIILNASTLRANKEGIFIITSPYDGSKIKLTALELKDLILHIKPEAVILPPKIIQQLPEVFEGWTDEIIPFIAAEDLLKQELPRTHGVYLHWDHSRSKETFLADVARWSHLPRYITGAISRDLMNDLTRLSDTFIETDLPAASAMQGIVTSQGGAVNVTENEAEMLFEVIDAACACPTCTQQFTKAYLHHLLLHTPLLCQRFLIQHNIFHAIN